MDSTEVEIFSVAFNSGVDLGSKLVLGVAIIAVLVVTAKLIRSM